MNKLINKLKKYMKEGVSPTSNKNSMEMDFPTAIKEVTSGKKITKLEWCNKLVYVLLENEFLMIYKDDGKSYKLILSEADIKGEDWILIN